ncbi:zinc finger BED domain-containing protein 5-like [Scylla paramamosain]|uniref:zinc finger BED domain-containing protein 5-like n=1 Tax=Scylla paramamosain TaxID=85552 RepID=UPI0030830DE3
MYFPEFKEEEGKMVRNPFSSTLDITTIPNDVQDELLDLKNYSAAKDLYEEKSLNVFWYSMHQSYPKVSVIALRLLLPFSTTYLCESGFSTFLQIKNKSRNRLHVDPNMRCALSVTQPRIRQLDENNVSLPTDVW